MNLQEAHDALTEEGNLRYIQFLKTTLSLSFGALLFLLAFEKDFVKEENELNLLVFVAWWLFAVSALSGFLSFFEWTAQPFRKAQAAPSPTEEMIQQNEENQTTVHIRAKTLLRDEIAFRLHLVCFALASLFLILYKSLNIKFYRDRTAHR